MKLLKIYNQRKTSTHNPDKCDKVPNVTHTVTYHVNCRQCVVVNITKLTTQTDHYMFHSPRNRSFIFRLRSLHECVRLLYAVTNGSIHHQSSCRTKAGRPSL